MNRNNEEQKDKLLDLIVNHNNGVLTYQYEYGIAIMYELICTQLYGKHFIKGYPISNRADKFGKIEQGFIRKMSVKLDETVDSESPKIECVPINWLETINNFRDNIVSISDSIFLLPFDSGLVKLQRMSITSQSGESACNATIPLITIYTWSDDNAAELAEFIAAGLVKGTIKKEAKNAYLMAIQTSFGISVKTLKFRPVECDIKKNYNDDLPYDEILRCLNSDRQELMLFYGPPGTGKTTLIKHIINLPLDKNIIVFDTNIMSTVGDDKFLNFLSSHSNSIIIMEDCDKVLSARENGNPIMSSILNLTDGLIGESFNIKFICTFNTSEKNIDPALLRKGRLSLMYKFKPLTVDKVRNFIPDATKEMPVGEIFNLKENIIGTNNNHKIGFHGTA